MVSKNKKKIGISNYIILLFIFVAVIGGTFLIRNIYLSSEENKMNEMILNDVLTNKLNIEELDNYLLENPDAIIYVSVNKDQDSKEIEESIKDYIIKNNLNDDVIYLVINEKDRDKFINKINDKYLKESEIKSLPLIMSFSDGKINKYIEKDNIINSFNSFIKGSRSI